MARLVETQFENGKMKDKIHSGTWSSSGHRFTRYTKGWCIDTCGSGNRYTRLDNQFTVSTEPLHFHMEQIINRGDTGSNMVICNIGAEFAQGYIIIYIGNTGTLTVGCTQRTGISQVSITVKANYFTSAEYGKWQCMDVIFYTSTKRVIAYLNSTQVADVTYSSAYDFDPITTASTPIYIAGLQTNGYPTGGYIGKFILQNHEPTAGEIASLYNDFLNRKDSINPPVDGFISPTTDNVIKHDPFINSPNRGTLTDWNLLVVSGGIFSIREGALYKYYQCLSDGQIYTTSIGCNNQTFVSRFYKSALSKIVNWYFIALTPTASVTGQQGYMLRHGSDDKIYLYRVTNTSNTQLFASTPTYTFGSEREYAVSRGVSGEMDIYLDGVKINDTVITDNTYTTSKWCVLDMDTSDYVSHIGVYSYAKRLNLPISTKQYFTFGGNAFNSLPTTYEFSFAAIGDVQWGWNSSGMYPVDATRDEAETNTIVNMINTGIGGKTASFVLVAGDITNWTTEDNTTDVTAVYNVLENLNCEHYPTRGNHDSREIMMNVWGYPNNPGSVPTHTRWTGVTTNANYLTYYKTINSWAIMCWDTSTATYALQDGVRTIPADEIAYVDAIATKYKINLSHFPMFSGSYTQNETLKTKLIDDNSRLGFSGHVDAADYEFPTGYTYPTRWYTVLQQHRIQSRWIWVDCYSNGTCVVTEVLMAAKT